MKKIRAAIVGYGSSFYTSHSLHAIHCCDTAVKYAKI